eukprot:9557664-Alexandrium_andersonii.AAC.1
MLLARPAWPARGSPGRGRGPRAASLPRCFDGGARPRLLSRRRCPPCREIAGRRGWGRGWRRGLDDPHR